MIEKFESIDAAIKCKRKKRAAPGEIGAALNTQIQ